MVIYSHFVHESNWRDGLKTLSATLSFHKVIIFFSYNTPNQKKIAIWFVKLIKYLPFRLHPPLLATQRPHPLPMGHS